MKKEFRECPICQSKENLQVMSESCFELLYSDSLQDGMGLVNVRCMNCHLELSVFCVYEHTSDYSELIDILRERWNTIKR